MDRAQDLLNERFVKLGTVSHYLADEDTAYDEENIWLPLGVGVPGSLQAQFPREEFRLETGSPRSLKMQAIVAVSGTVQLSLHEHTALGLKMAVGNDDGQITYATTPVATTVKTGTSTVTNVLLTAVTGALRGQLIEVGGQEMTHIEKVTTDGVIVKPALSIVPASGDTVKWVKSIKHGIGGEDVLRKAYKGVFEDQYGEKVIIYLPSVTSSGGYSPNFGDGSTNVQLPLTLNAIGKSQTWNGKQQQLVGYIIHEFAGVS